MMNTGLAGCRVDETAVFSSTSSGPHTDCARAESRCYLRVIHTVDASAGRVDETASNTSTGPPLGSERRFLWRVRPARSDYILVLNSRLPMELHVEIDALVSRIADALRKHEEQLLSELVARISQELKATPDSLDSIEISGATEIKGIQPYALYSVSCVAKRWSVSADNVRKKPQSELPRSDWKGGEIRYRGIDILRYEGVDVEEHLDSLSPELEKKGQFPDPGQSEDHPRRAGEGNGNGRPYSSDLPALSDDSASTD